MFLNPQMHLKSVLTVLSRHDANVKWFGVVCQKENLWQRKNLKTLWSDANHKHKKVQDLYSYF